MTATPPPALGYGAAPLGLGSSRRFSEFSSGLVFDDLPAAVVHECQRGLLDWVGRALAGSGHHTLTTLRSGLSAAGGLERLPVIGRQLKVGLLEAATVNGQMGHVLDFDDTHMDGVVLHTSSPVLAALLSACALAPRSGRELMVAYALGFEAGVRVGKAAPGPLLMLPAPIYAPICATTPCASKASICPCV